MTQQGVSRWSYHIILAANSLNIEVERQKSNLKISFLHISVVKIRLEFTFFSS